MSIFLRRWISQSRRVALSKVSLKPPTNAFSSSVPKAIKFFNSGSRDFKVPPESEYVCCVFFTCRSTEPIIGGRLPSSLRRVMRCWYEIGVTLYGPKPNVGSSVKGRYSTGLQQNRFTDYRLTTTVQKIYMCISLTEKDIDPLFKVVVVFQHIVFPL